MSDLQPTEIYLYCATAVAIFSFLYLIIMGKDTKKVQVNQEKKKEEKDDLNIIEIFDYLGTKIIHENGKYTVNHEGKVHTYNSWLELAPKFQKMVKELDSRSQETKKSDDYFLETINGFYYLTFPGGKKKKYRSLSEIPEKIRKAIGK
ncbi:MAG: hypothetical protein SFU98_04175 [Leptospiraceae bacterium]|nr:hypothetical protein [Leptospiraceae bacterium]